jgi:hypothetical protein
MALSRANLDRLIRILGLLGSDQPGERASAGLAAHKLLSAAKLSWSELLKPKSEGSVSRAQYGVDPQAAAEARMRQLKTTNDRLEREVRSLRRRLTTIAEQRRRARQALEEAESD